MDQNNTHLPNQFPIDAVVTGEWDDDQESIPSLEDISRIEEDRFNREREAFETWPYHVEENQLDAEVDKTWKKIKIDVETEVD